VLEQFREPVNDNAYLFPENTFKLLFTGSNKIHLAANRVDEEVIQR
jgi:hypothetical protein